MLARSLLGFSLAALAVVLFACGGRTSGSEEQGAGGDSGSSGGSGRCVDIDFTKVDVACQQASDCFGLFVGELCDGQCACPNFAANVSGQSAYDETIAPLKLADCFCPDAPIECIDLRCTVQGLETADAGAGPDAHVCVDVVLSTYDQSCTGDGDCIQITSGEICTGQCTCGGSAINASGQSRYEEAVSGVQEGTCPCVDDGTPRCVGGECVMCGGGPGQPAGCPDGG